jgi:alanine-synthesizing transaminase
LLADPGDEVLVPRPSYPLFEFLATMESLRVVSYPLVYHGGWSIDCHALAAAITPRTRAIVVVNPNNPTGSFLKRDELRFLQSLELPLISDEVFADYAFSEDAQRVRTLADTTETLAFSMSGLSKIAGLPQMKLGWIVISGPPAERAEARDKLEWIADTYLSVSAPVQQAAPRLLELGRGIQQQIAARVRANLAWLASAIAADSPCRILAVEGGWYATLQVPRIRREEEWALDLLEQRQRPGAARLLLRFRIGGVPGAQPAHRAGNLPGRLPPALGARGLRIGGGWACGPRTATRTPCEEGDAYSIGC